MTEPADPQRRGDEEDPPLGDRGQEIVAQLTEVIDQAESGLGTAIEAIDDETLAELEETQAAVGAIDVELDSLATAQQVTDLDAEVDSLATAQSVVDLSGKVDGLATQQSVTDLTKSIGDLTDTMRKVLDQIATEHTEDAKVMARIDSGVQAILDILQDAPGPGSWQDQPDLIDVNLRPVLGIHTGGDAGTKSDPKAISDRMGQLIQAAPIYWKGVDSPREACQRMLNAGTVPRLELCLPHIFTSAGHKMQDDGSFWSRVPMGTFDDEIGHLLSEVGVLDRPILLSLGHESDLRSEDGASPKSGNPPKTNYCGEWDEYPAYHEHLAAMARTLAPRARIFLNFSGGYDGAPSRWDQMLPTAGTFDFFGWDPYNNYGKAGSTQWDSFATRLKMFGRWDWYKRNLPDVPLIIGETATCQGPGGDKDAGKWLLDMIDSMVENRWQGVGTGGGISQIHYFSHHYADHPRCLDEPHDGATGQMWAVLPQVGADERLAWA